MATQMTAARRGVATDEMKQVAKDEDVSLDWLIPKIASGSIIIPSNNVRPQKIHNVGISQSSETSSSFATCFISSVATPRRAAVI